MEKFFIYASVVVIPLLYELLRRILPQDYLFAALALHWGLTAAALYWTKTKLAGPNEIGLRRPILGFICFAICVGVYSVILNSLFVSESLADWQWGLPGMTTFKRSGVFIIAISAGFCEEIIYRGYMMTALKKVGQPVWAAMVLSSISFVLFHGFQPVWFLLPAFVITMILAAIYQSTGILWVTIYIHAFWDLTISLIPWHTFASGA